MTHSRKKLTDLHIAASIDNTYKGRVVLVSEYRTLTSTSLFYCHDCKNWFFQLFRSIRRGYQTRCACLPATQRGNDKGDGWNRPLPEWECYDRVRPVDKRNIDKIDKSP